MKIIINKPRFATIGHGMYILYDLEHNQDQLKKLIEDMLLEKSIIADEVKIVDIEVRKYE